MKKYLIIILLLLSNCRWVTGSSASPFAMLGVPEPDGTPLFKQGFEQGCKAIISRRGTEFFRQTYEYDYNVSLIDNPEYQFGFSRGWTNCFNHIVSGSHTLGGSADTYFYNSLWGGGGRTGPFSMGKGTIDHSINEAGNTWGMGSLGGNIDDALGTFDQGKGGKGTIFGSHPLWGTWQTDQIFGQ